MKILSGEHGEWMKQTNFELATHTPLMIHIPGLTEKGIVSEHLTEFVDIFPTLVEAAGLPAIPLCPENSAEVKVCREGMSLMPLISDPQHIDWKTRVFSQYPRGKDVMGYSMRTEHFRYTEWVGFLSEPEYTPVWDDLVGTELYDHRVDPGENKNVADLAEYNEIQKDLKGWLHKGWRHAHVSMA